jgi:hypothetical protein
MSIHKAMRRIIQTAETVFGETFSVTAGVSFERKSMVCIVPSHAGGGRSSAKVIASKTAASTRREHDDSGENESPVAEAPRHGEALSCIALPWGRSCMNRYQAEDLSFVSHMWRNN